MLFRRQAQEHRAQRRCRARSNGRRASSRTSRSASAPRLGGGKPERSQSGSGNAARPSAPRTTWTGSPASAPKTVRKASWRRTTPAKAAASAGTSSRPSQPQGHGQVVDRGGRDRAGRGTRGAAGRTRAAASRRAGTAELGAAPRGLPVRAARVTDPLRERRQRRRLEEGAQRQLDAEGAARPARPPGSPRSEWPPSSKKLSPRPTVARSRPRTSAQMPASISSAGVRGAARRPYPLPVPPLRPLRPVRGAQGPAVHLAAGSLGAGSPVRRRAPGPCTRAAAPPGSGAARAAPARRHPRPAGTIQATSRRRRPPRADHRGRRRTAGWALRAASISPGSMRKPRILTCAIGAAEELQAAVRQPAHEVAGAIEARSRHVREGVGDEALRGQVGPAEIAAGEARAAEQKLARDAGRHRLRPSRSRT